MCGGGNDDEIDIFIACPEVLTTKEFIEWLSLQQYEQ